MSMVPNTKLEKKPVDSIATLLLLTGIYIFPERIKIISLLFVFVYIVIALLKHYQFVFDFTTISIIAYCIIGLFGVLSTDVSITNVLEFVASLLMGVMIYGFDCPIANRERQLKTIKVLVFVVIIGCILQLISIDTLRSINRFTLGQEKYLIFDMFYRGRCIVGFSYQTGVTGFYLAIASVLFLILFLRKGQKRIRRLFNLFLTGISMILLFFTAKRIFIALVGLLSFMLICLYYKKHYLKIVVFSLIIILGLLGLLYYTELGKSILMRMSLADPTTGRRAINQQLLNWFLQAPMVGKGVTSTLNLLGNYQNGHNIYLQILSESGLIGFICLVSAFVLNLFKSVKLILHTKNDARLYDHIAFSLALQLLFLGWGFTGNPLYDTYPFIVYVIATSYINRMYSNNFSRIKHLYLNYV